MQGRRDVRGTAGPSAAPPATHSRVESPRPCRWAESVALSVSIAHGFSLFLQTVSSPCQSMPHDRHCLASSDLRGSPQHRHGGPRVAYLGLGPSGCRTQIFGPERFTATPTRRPARSILGLRAIRMQNPDLRPPQAAAGQPHQLLDCFGTAFLGKLAQAAFLCSRQVGKQRNMRPAALTQWATLRPLIGPQKTKLLFRVRIHVTSPAAINVSAEPGAMAAYNHACVKRQRPSRRTGEQVTADERPTALITVDMIAVGCCRVYCSQIGRASCRERV